MALPEVVDEYFSSTGFKRGLSDEDKEAGCAQIRETFSPEKQKDLDAQKRRQINDRATFDALPDAARLKGSERKPTGHNSDELASMTPAHKAMMSSGPAVCGPWKAAPPPGPTLRVLPER